MKASFRRAAAAVGAAAFIASPLALVAAQDTDCVSLRGSRMCPAFEDAFINPANLTSDFSFFENVTDTSSFDEEFERYFLPYSAYYRTKVRIDLQCNRTGSANVTGQWEQTFLCGIFSERSFNSGCASGQENPTVVCADTCADHGASQQAIVDNPVNCAPTERLFPDHYDTRVDTLNRDNATCAGWNTLVSNNQASCVMGITNEGNCGYGDGLSTQLCAACDPTGNRQIPTCCNAQNTTLSGCAAFGHPAAALVRPFTSTSSSPEPTSTSGMNGGATSDADSAASGTTANMVGLTTNQLAGILVGSIIAALLVGFLLAFLLFGRKRRQQRQHNNMAGGAVYGAAGDPRSHSGEKGWAHSEDGMSRDAASPEKGMGAPAGGGNAGTYAGLGALGAGAAGLGAAAAAGHNRESPQAGRPTSAALTSSSGGGEGRGTTVTSVRDQYTGQDIHVGEDVVAIYPYNASLNDEITLEPEQHITILRLYDDGWALGRTQEGQEGALPLVCVSSTKGDIAGRQGTGTGTSGTSEDEGLTSGNEYTSSVDGAVTAEEGATSDARSNRSRGVMGR